MKTIHVTFDELTTMAYEQFSSGPRLQSMTPANSHCCTPQELLKIAATTFINTIDQDAPSSSTSSTNQKQQSSIISRGVKKPIPNAHFDNPCCEPLHDVSTSQESSLNVQSSSLSIKRIDTPMVEKNELDTYLQGTPADATHYRPMIGSLMYLSSSRPGLIYAVCLCARYQAKPTEKHLNTVKWIFQYLKGTINMGL
ncbi:hypothetical protein Tco_0916831 [Tanacetum coccineum]